MSIRISDVQKITLAIQTHMQERVSTKGFPNDGETIAKLVFKEEGVSFDQIAVTKDGRVLGRSGVRLTWEEIERILLCKGLI